MRRHHVGGGAATQNASAIRAGAGSGKLLGDGVSAQNTHRLVAAAASVNATLVSAFAKQLYSIDCFNGAVVTYLKIYDKATAPTEADTPRRTIYLPANARVQLEWKEGLLLSRGLGFRLTLLGADGDTGAVAANAVLALNLDYT